MIWSAIGGFFCRRKAAIFLGETNTFDVLKCEDQYVKDQVAKIKSWIEQLAEIERR